MSSPNPLPVLLSVEADDDFTDILVLGIQAWGEAAARSYGDNLLQALQRLGTFPNLGAQVEDIRPATRRLVFRQHVAFYRVDDSAVTIVRILHQRQETRGNVDR